MNKIVISALTVAGLTLAFVLGKNDVGAIPLSGSYALGSFVFGLAVLLAGSYGRAAARAAIGALIAGMVVGVFLVNDVAPFMSLFYVPFAGFLARPAGWPAGRIAAYAGLAALPFLLALIVAPTFMKGFTLGIVAGAFGAAFVLFDEDIRAVVDKARRYGLRHLWTTESEWPAADVIEVEGRRMARVHWGESPSTIYRFLRLSAVVLAFPGAILLALHLYDPRLSIMPGRSLLFVAAVLYGVAWLLPSKSTRRALHFDIQGAVIFATDFGKAARPGDYLPGGLASIRSVESSSWLEWNPQPEAQRSRHAHHFETFFLTADGDRVVISDNYGGREFHIKLVATVQKVMEGVRQAGRQQGAKAAAPDPTNPFYD